jgi:hypothetical protein
MPSGAGTKGVPDIQQSFDLNFIPIFLKVVDLCSFFGAAKALCIAGSRGRNAPRFSLSESFRTLRLRQVCRGWSFSRKAVSIVKPYGAQRSQAVNLFTEFLAAQMREKLY